MTPYRRFGAGASARRHGASGCSAALLPSSGGARLRQPTIEVGGIGPFHIDQLQRHCASDAGDGELQTGATSLIVAEGLADQPASEARPCGRSDFGSVGFFPKHGQKSLTRAVMREVPTQLHLAGRNGERAVLGRIRRQFMEGQRQRDGLGGMEPDRGPVPPMWPRWPRASAHDPVEPAQLT